MKQLIITIACILIILVGGTLEIKYITKCATYLKYDLEYIKNATNNNNYEFAKSHMTSIKRLWNKEKVLWNIFVTNDEAGDIGKEINKLDEYIKQEDKNNVLLQIAILQDLLNDAIMNHKISIESVI